MSSTISITILDSNHLYVVTLLSPISYNNSYRTKENNFFHHELSIPKNWSHNYFGRRKRQKKNLRLESIPVSVSKTPQLTGFLLLIFIPNLNSHFITKTVVTVSHSAKRTPIIIEWLYAVFTIFGILHPIMIILLYCSIVVVVFLIFLIWLHSHNLTRTPVKSVKSFC